MIEAKQVWVIVEFSDEEVKPVSFEAIHAARLLADSLQGTVFALCLSLDSPNQVQDLLHYGADRVQVLKNSLFGTFSLLYYLIKHYGAFFSF